MPRPVGRHFLQIPGPTNVPERILRAMAQSTIDHRGPEFVELWNEVRAGLARVIGTDGEVVLYPGSGTGAWEAALSNTLNPGDRVLMCDTGHFATKWLEMASQIGLQPEVIEVEWGNGADPEAIEAKLKEDESQKIKAVCIVHNETSTGVASRLKKVREAIDSARHPALYMVDTISSLASIPYNQDGLGVDVTIGCSQKGLMLPPGFGFNGISEKALDAAKGARKARSYWEWTAMIQAAKSGSFSYTPPTNLLYGLREAIGMLEEEGMDNVFARHDRHAEATRRCVRHWGLDLVCRNPEEYSSSLTAVWLPQGHDADEFRKIVLERFNMSLGNGLGQLAGRVFRIGHLGDFNDLMLAGTLSGVEMGLAIAGVPFNKGGVQTALDYLAGNA
jgi:alanine-glyoxylate transaminase / serine-glyoxylate transaminase / serine-pyruvate transaminase